VVTWVKGKQETEERVPAMVGLQSSLSFVPLDLAATFQVEVMKHPGLYDATKHERWGAVMERSEEGKKRRNRVVDSWRRR
jgi:hypothetical protein